MSIFSSEKKNTEAAEAEANPVDKSVKNAKKRLTAKKRGTAISSVRLMSKGAFAAAAGLMLLMGITYAASAMMSARDAFIIRAEQLNGENAVISLSETQGFANPVMNLSAKAIDDMDNITYAWLPLDELDAYDGSHNGENYIAYTFYLRNAGKTELHYSTELKITKRTRRVDEAVRIMLYKNGEKTIYAKPNAGGGTEYYPKAVTDFCDKDLVMKDTASRLQPDEYDRYTVVIWLEGEDPECIDLIRGGTLRMELVFSALSDDGEITENAAELSRMLWDESKKQPVIQPLHKKQFHL